MHLVLIRRHKPSNVCFVGIMICGSLWQRLNINRMTKHADCLSFKTLERTFSSELGDITTSQSHLQCPNYSPKSTSLNRVMSCKYQHMFYPHLTTLRRIGWVLTWDLYMLLATHFANHTILVSYALSLILLYLLSTDHQDINGISFARRWS